MFGKRKPTDSKDQPTSTGPAEARAPHGRTAGRPAAPAQAQAGPVARPRPSQDAPRVAREAAPGAGRRPEAAATPADIPGPGEDRRLVVGQQIQLSGEIRKCDKLLVEGQVEGSLTESKALEITETGLFKGSAIVNEAEISGSFDGELAISGRLFVRATGRVEGHIRYGELEIERGGRLTGDIDLIGAEPMQRIEQANGVRPELVEETPEFEPEPARQAPQRGKASERRRQASEPQVETDEAEEQEPTRAVL